MWSGMYDRQPAVGPNCQLRLGYSRAYRRAHSGFRSAIIKPLRDAVSSPVRKWWNWQTHHLEGVAPKGVGVQIPPSAPIFSHYPSIQTFIVLASLALVLHMFTSRLLKATVHPKVEPDSSDRSRPFLIFADPVSNACLV
jgi:hypothetical protein